MAGGGVERVPSPGGACWICGLPAVCGEKLPGRRHTVRALCQSHADAVFGLEDPPWKRLDAETQRAVNRLRDREAMVHAAVTQILLDWYATASGQTRAQAIQRLALTLGEMFEGPGDLPS